MKFYIVTPAFNGMQWLPACVRSVRDQVGPDVEVHHHVQDGGSADGTLEWLEAWHAAHGSEFGYTLTWVSERDQGMYDAINRAWEAMPSDAEVTAHLNCDEQYLPGALSCIAVWMRKRPRAEALLGTYVITDAAYEYVCHRRPVVPKRWSSWLNCACITNSCFYRAEDFRRRRPRFDTQWKSVGDLVFFRDLTEQGVRFATVPLVTSCFMCTGRNLAWTEQGQREWNQLREQTPSFWRLVNGFVYRWVNLQRRLADWFMRSPREYSVYLGDSERRTSLSIDEPTVIWRPDSRRARQNAAGKDA